MGKERFSFSTGALYPYDSVTALQLIHDAGFPRAELMPQALSDVSEESTLAFEKTGILLGSIHYPLVFFGMQYNCTPSMIADSRIYAKKLLGMGKRLDCHILVVHPHDVPSLKGHDALLNQPMIDNLRWLADTCADYGYTMAMENHPRSAPTAKDLLDYIAMLDRPSILPMVDTTEVKEADGEPAEFLRQLTPCHLHMSDFGTFKHVPAGDGIFDWKDIRAALEEKQYKGYFTLEPAYRWYIDEPLKELRRAYKFLEDNFGDFPSF